jgi:hypothetical protein
MLSDESRKAHGQFRDVVVDLGRRHPDELAVVAKPRPLGDEESRITR